MLNIDLRMFLINSYIFCSPEYKSDSDKRIYVIFMVKNPILLLVLVALFSIVNTKIIFEDNFTTFNFSKWRHDITMSGGGNWEFQLYDNNRSTSFVSNGTLKIKPMLTEDKIGADKVRNGYNYDMWGGNLANLCTGNNFYGCARFSDGNHYINPIMSAKITSSSTFHFTYGRV